MNLETIRQRVSRIDPLVVDIVVAVVLGALVCLQIYAVQHVRPPQPDFVPNLHQFRRLERDPGVLPYLLALCAFLPLSFRRSVPWLSLALTGTGAALYALQHFPPAFTVLGPMIAIYSLASYAKRRYMGMLAVLVTGVILAVPVLAFSSSIRWVAEAAGSLAMLAASGFLGDTARNRREYIAEVERRALDAEKSREEEALRRVEEERVRIARDVHDIVAHSLSIVTVQAAAADAVLDKDPEQARESIRHIRSTSKQALGELRSMLDVLRTGEGDAPLEPAADLTHLDALVRRVREAGLDVSLNVQGELAALPAYASVSAYRIVQEALTNVVRHAHATHVDVSIRVHGAELEATVADDGIGASFEALAGGGHGVRGMRERIDALGGRFEAAGAAGGKGLCVSAYIPLTRSES